MVLAPEPWSGHAALAAALVAEAEGWIGTPFVWQGRVRGVGADCKGLLAGVAAACGRAEGASLEALAGDYGARVPVPRLRAGLARLFDRVPGEERLPGDVLLVRMAGQAQHLALAAPSARHPARSIEAVIGARVGFYRRPPEVVDSVWRWRAPVAACGGEG